MTNIEMDDVLSSIRRLVSEGVDKNQTPESEKDDRFVLTPALRVHDAPGKDINENAKVDEDISPPAELAQVLTSVADTIRDAEQGAEPKAPSPEFAAMETAWKAELAKVSADRENEQVDLSEEPDHDSQSLEHQIAELEEAVGQTADEWEPDGSEPEASQPMRRHIFEVVSNPDLDDVEDAEEYDDDDEVPVFSHMSAPRPKPYVLSDEVVEIETAELSNVTPIDQHTGDDDTTPTNVVDDDDVFLDVEALRTMITEVVRDELQGKLGETITRNVRKMIQQEISQAITELPLDDDY